MGGNGGKWGEMGKTGENVGKLVPEDCKTIQLPTNVAKFLQTQAPILVLGSVFHHVVLSCGWYGRTLLHLLAAYVIAAAHNGAHVLPSATL